MTPVRARQFTTALLLLAATAGCGGADTSPTAENTHAEGSIEPAHAAPAACAGGVRKLPATGLCPEQAAALLLAAPGPAAAPPDGCTWTIGETALNATEAVVYRAARCQSRTTKLDFVAGKPFGRFTLAASPYEGAYDAGEPIVRAAAVGDSNGILKVARSLMSDPKDPARCRLRAAAMEGWPADALVIDEVPQPQSDEVRSACGELGLDEDAQTFWRLSQRIGWFFQLGQESPIVDAGSFTLLRRGAAGEWRPAGA